MSTRIIFLVIVCALGFAFKSVYLFIMPKLIDMASDLYRFYTRFQTGKLV